MRWGVILLYLICMSEVIQHSSTLYLNGEPIAVSAVGVPLGLGKAERIGIHPVTGRMSFRMRMAEPILSGQQLYQYYKGLQRKAARPVYLPTHLR